MLPLDQVDLSESDALKYLLSFTSASWSDFLTKSITLYIWFSTVVIAVVVVKLVISCISVLTSFIVALRAVVVAKLVILSISFLTSIILELRVVLVAKLVILVILSSISLIFASDTSFLTTSFFTRSRSLCKSTRTGFNLSAPNLDNLWISDFKLAKSCFLVKCDESTSVAFFRSGFDFIFTVIIRLKITNFCITISFLSI